MKFPEISELYSVYQKFPNVITDSRKASANSIFFALKGDNFNGNQFAESALQQGCNYAIIDEEQYYIEEKTILVKDCLKTLQDIAMHHRTQLKIPVIGITGSNGKTTTKELIKIVLSKKYRVLATVGNLNNHIGVPLTILSISPDIEIAVIEMGANHVGEIELLCEIAQPGFGLITNIGKAHIGEFGSFENVIKTKTELFLFLRNNKGKIFINSSDNLLLSNALKLEKISYGNSENDFSCCKFLEANPLLKVLNEKEVISSKLIGKYNFENVSAAICIGKYFKVETQKIKEAIEEYTPSNNRSQIIHTKKHTLVLDAYNANPSSMKVAIENFSELSLKELSSDGKGENKWLILGDMLELGEYEINEHKKILQLLTEKKLHNVILVGEKFSRAASEMKKNFLQFNSSDELAKALKSNSPIGNNSLILIKGSRGIKLEKVVEFL